MNTHHDEHQDQEHDQEKKEVMQVKTSIFEGLGAAAVQAATDYRPESIRDFHDQVQALAPVLQQVTAAVRALRERGHEELPLDQAVLEHLEQVAVELDCAVAVAAEGGPLLHQLRAEAIAREDRWLHRRQSGGEAA